MAVHSNKQAIPKPSDVGSITQTCPTALVTEKVEKFRRMGNTKQFLSPRDKSCGTSKESRSACLSLGEISNGGDSRFLSFGNGD
ncbi:hypothetical protein AVEN_112912-1 [Araneus ventricosus]|uniref:Uncharacterized protein n=1 Tax=Araneus ventricosus TaxID=182803 RepID=A0A4Y2LUY5_ARAVE|nr:hypothetical protein AVEN_112912-1 [Araneus ventricosus]